MSRDANNYFISEENSSGEAIAMSIYGTWQQKWLVVGRWWCQYGIYNEEFELERKNDGMEQRDIFM